MNYILVKFRWCYNNSCRMISFGCLIPLCYYIVITFLLHNTPITFYHQRVAFSVLSNVYLEPLISHTGILMTFYLSIILDLQNFFHWYIIQSWKLKRSQIQLRPHHFWTYTSNLTTVVNSVLKFMINGTTSILISWIFQRCAAIYQLVLHMMFTSHNWFVMQGPVAIILIS